MFHDSGKIRGSDKEMDKVCLHCGRTWGEHFDHFCTLEERDEKS